MLYSVFIAFVYLRVAGHLKPICPQSIRSRSFAPRVTTRSKKQDDSAHLASFMRTIINAFIAFLFAQEILAFT